MRKLTLLFLFLIICTLAGCSNDDLLNSPYYGHDLRVRVVDQFGNNQVKGIETEKQDENEREIIATRLYTRRMKTSHDETGGWKLYYELINDEEYLELSFGTPLYQEPIISHFLRCERIFGDDLEHEIVAFYSKGSDNPSRVTFDGIELNVEGNSQVTVTVNR